MASNFSNTAKQIATSFEQSTGHKVVLAFGSTGQQYAQILNGAPFDMFLAADRERPLLLDQAGLALEGSRFTYAIGRLVLWSPSSAVTDLVSLSEIDDYRHLAIANPKLAPYGLAAIQVLEGLDLLDKVQPKLVQGENVAQAFQFVESGAADMGLVALSQIQAMPAEERGAYQILSDDLYDPIRQQAVLLNQRQSALQFAAFLTSEKVQKIILDAGYALEQ